MARRTFIALLILAALACGSSSAPPLSPAGADGQAAFPSGRYRLDLLISSPGSCGEAVAPALTSVIVWVRISPGTEAGTYAGRPDRAGNAFELRLNAARSARVPPFQVPVTGTLKGTLQDEGPLPTVPPKGVRADVLPPGAALTLEGTLVFPSVIQWGRVNGQVQFSDGTRTVTCSAPAFMLLGPST